MHVVKGVIGALVGGALGIGLMVLVEAVWEHEFSWIVLIVGVLTGACARLFAIHDDASYLRGMLSCVITLAALVCGEYVVAYVVTQRTSSLEKPAARPGGETAEETGGPALIVQEAPLPVEGIAPELAAIRRGGSETTVWDFVLLAMAGLIAYELGRGSAGKSPRPAVGNAEPMQPETEAGQGSLDAGSKGPAAGADPAAPPDGGRYP